MGLGHAKRTGAMAEVANDAQVDGYSKKHDLQQDLLASPLGCPTLTVDHSLFLSHCFVYLFHLAGDAEPGDGAAAADIAGR